MSTINRFLNTCFRKFYSLANETKGFAAGAIRRNSRLEAKDLTDLFAGKTIALHISNFCSNKAIDHAVKKLGSRQIVEYSNAQGVGKVQDLGMAYFEVEDEASKQKYYAQVQPSFEALRKTFDPYLSPIDKMRVTLDEQWPKGSSLLNLDHGPMFVGLVRSTSTEILPHEDKLERDDPSISAKVQYVAQAAFNCYLTVPEREGALQLWNISLKDEDYNRLRGSSYGIPRSSLPSPHLTIQPEKGDLVVFNPRYLHAVGKVTKNRIATSGFILYQGKERSLHVWS